MLSTIISLLILTATPDFSAIQIPNAEQQDSSTKEVRSADFHHVVVYDQSFKKIGAFSTTKDIDSPNSMYPDKIDNFTFSKQQKGIVCIIVQSVRFFQFDGQSFAVVRPERIIVKNFK